MSLTCACQSHNLREHNSSGEGRPLPSVRACVRACVHAEGDEWVRKKRLVLPLVRTPHSGRVKSYPGGKDESIVGLVAGKFFALPTA